ncbi:MAG TPA: DNA polymerase III subunit beta [Anaerolinea thermolimosa]|uniref:Beta sliding clamp n=2 Tax=Anaerolinea thermolimosa TaxID=229919 RepID=A0A3D1JGX2_9CHLR|nr:DNA polymerase III subunit beta [Anaerolinea thermolimosa]
MFHDILLTTFSKREGVMKVSVSQQQLAHGLSIVSRAVSPRSTLPVLGNVLLATDEGRLRLAATNLELGISCWIGAQIKDEGSITVPARLFSDLVNILPNDTVTLGVNPNTFTLSIRCGTSSTEIKGIDAQEFPPMPAGDLSDGVQLKVADFKEMISQVAFAASTDEARPVLQGVQMTLAEREITLAATDGFRISVRKAELPEPVSRPISVIVPARALSELARIAQDGEAMLTLSAPPGRGQIIFRLDNAELVSQLIDGNFPDYRAILPRAYKTHTIVSTQALLKACRQAEIIARGGNNVVRLSLEKHEDRPGEIEVSAQTEETGVSEAKVEANIEGPTLAIAFNVRFLREVLEVIKTPNLVLDTNDQKSPARVQPVGDESFQHIIMPMHLG